MSEVKPTTPKIAVPAPVTPEELDRRRQAVARMRALREKIGPINMSVDELLETEDSGST